MNAEQEKSSLAVNAVLSKSSAETMSFSELATALQESLQALESTCVNVGITGEPRAGKSTLINAIRDLCKLEEGAAPTGGTGANKEPTAYPHPKFANVVLWDLPSIDSQDFQPKAFLEQIGVSSYDFFLILTDRRFTTCHADLAQGVKRSGKGFYFVRSKIDEVLDLAHQHYPSGVNEAVVLRKVRESCVRSLQAAGVASPKVFLISSLLTRKYDFPLLEESLGKGLDPRKSHAFLLAMPNASHRLLETKKHSIVENMWLVAVVASGVNAVPVPGLAISCNWDRLVRTLQGCCISFGLEEASLRKVAEDMEQPYEDLRALVKSPLATDINQELVEQLLEQAARKAPRVPREVLSCTVIKESMATLGLSCPMVYQMLKEFVNEVVADAHRVLVKVFMSRVPRRESDTGTSASAEEEEEKEEEEVEEEQPP